MAALGVLYDSGSDQQRSNLGQPRIARSRVREGRLPFTSISVGEADL